MTRSHHQVAPTGSLNRGTAVRFLHISLPVFPYHSDAAFVAADPEAQFHA